MQALSEALSKVYEKYLKQAKLKSLSGERDLRVMLTDMINGTLQAKFTDMTTSIKSMSEKLDEHFMKKSRDLSLRQSFNNVLIDDGREVLNGSYESSKKQTPPRHFTSATKSLKKESASIGVQVSLDDDKQTRIDIYKLPESSNVKLESDQSDRQQNLVDSPEGENPRPFQTVSPRHSSSRASEKLNENQLQSQIDDKKSVHSVIEDNKSCTRCRDNIKTVPRHQMQYDAIFNMNQIKQRLDNISEQLTTFKFREVPVDLEKPSINSKRSNIKDDSMSNFSEQMADVENNGMLATKHPEIEAFNSSNKKSELFREFIPLVNSFQNQQMSAYKTDKRSGNLNSQNLNLAKRIIEVFAEFIEPRSVIENKLARLKIARPME